MLRGVQGQGEPPACDIGGERAAMEYTCTTKIHFKQIIYAIVNL